MAMKLDDYRLLGRSGLRVSPLALGTHRHALARQRLRRIDAGATGLGTHAQGRGALGLGRAGLRRALWAGLRADFALPFFCNNGNAAAVSGGGGHGF